MASFRRVLEPLTIQGNYSVEVYECNVEIGVIQFTEEFDYLMVGTADGQIHAVKENAIAFTLLDDVSFNSAVTGLKHHPVSRNYPITNTFMCSYANGMLKCWNYNFKACTYSTEENRRTLGISYHPKLVKFVTYGDNMKIYMYDDDSKKQERVLSASDVKGSTDGHTNTVTCACFHPQNVSELISGSLDATIQIWDTRQPHSVRKFSGIVLDGPGLEFTAKGTEFITCSPQGKNTPTLKLWEYRTGNELIALDSDKFKNTPLHCGTHINKNEFVCGGGPPGFVRIVNVPNLDVNGLISNIPSPVTSITTGRGTPLFAFSAGKRVYFVSATQQ